MRLDVRTLAREGGLQPGATATVTWYGGASITTVVAPNDADIVTLRYRSRTGYGPWRAVSEYVSVTRTPCTLGGTRDWFGCPGCGTRCAVLYAFLDQFRCRSCHQLAYASTRARR